jgi:ribosomal protein L3 glutamine methyltransferase
MAASARRAKMSDADKPEDHLATVRDWLRYAVTRFNAAGLNYGHGTGNALDEAAYLILHTLHLPLDQLDPWLDARLLASERARVGDIIDKRIGTRKPAPYLTNEAWIGAYSFYVDERVIVPRSYLGELLCRQMQATEGEWHLGADTGPVGSVLDLCTGSACLAILAALTFPEATVDASDLSPDALEVARRNIADYGLEARISLAQSDLFSAHAGRSYDLILANPPYVDAETLAAFPPELAAEPAIAHAGGADGLDLVRRIIAAAGDHLAPEGALLVEVGRGRPILEQEFADLPFIWLDTAESEGEVFALPASALR